MIDPAAASPGDAMKLLFVVGHPAHVHFFRHTIEEMRSGGHEVLIGVVAKETTLELLALYGYDYDVLGGNVPNLLGKVLDLPAKDFRFFRFLSRKRPDLVLSVSSPYAAHACAALSVPHIAFSDTEIAKAILSLTYPFTDAFLTPASFAGNLGARHIRYNGYKELAYLHPNWFKPNSEVLDLIGAGADETLILVRFASWDSSHDFGTRSLRVQPAQRMITIVNELKKYGRILLTSECPLPPELQEYTIHIPLHRIHDLLSYASLYLGEGATMAAEAGVLGTPWIFVSPSGRGYLQEQQQRYGLGFWERSDRDAIDRAVGILSRRNLRAEWKSKQQTLLADKIDVTRYIIEFVEGWPRSFDEEMARAHVVREAPQPQPARG